MIAATARSPGKTARPLPAHGGARLHTTDELGHRRILRDPDVLARVVAFLAPDAVAGKAAPLAEPRRPEQGATGGALTAGDAAANTLALDAQARAGP